MTSLILVLPLLPAGPATPYDYAISIDGETASNHGSVPLGLLPPVASGAEVVALVPAQALSWHQVTLPRGTLGRAWLSDGGSPRLRNVLVGLLEERLLDEPAQLHFALAPLARDDAPVWVAACDRAWLRAALQALEQAGKTAARIVPEFVPDTGTPAVVLTGDEAHARIIASGPRGVLVLPPGSASVALLHWPADAAIVAEPAVAALAEALFQRPARLQLNAERWLQAAASGWDLAQFELVNSGSGRAWKRLAAALRTLARAPRWRAARWAMAALLLTQLAGINAWAWKEQNLLQEKRSALSQAVTSTFPHVKLVVYPQQQMESELAALRLATGAPSGQDLESLLAALAAAAPPGKPLSGIDFVTGELRAKGLMLAPVEQSQLQAQLQARGIAARMDGDMLVLKVGGRP